MSQNPPRYSLLARLNHRKSAGQTASLSATSPISPARPAGRQMAAGQTSMARMTTCRAWPPSPRSKPWSKPLAGAMADIVKLTVFVTDIRRREQVWQARSEFFEGDFPSSSLVEVSKLADPAVTVEIEAIAHIGGSRTLQ